MPAAAARGARSGQPAGAHPGRGAPFPCAPAAARAAGGTGTAPLRRRAPAERSEVRRAGEARPPGAGPGGRPAGADRSEARRAGEPGLPAAAPGARPADPDQPRGERQHLPRHAAAPIRLSRRRRGGAVKAVRLHAFHDQPVIDEVPEPAIGGPLDVIVKIGGAGVCRTDLHIIEGQWDAAMGTPLPYILGHENAGWVHEVGSAVTNVSVGDTVILHPTPTCGLCRACRAGDDMHCVASTFPGLSTDGGMAEYLLTSARACVKLDPQTKPEDVAALADAGITAYHAVRKAIPLLYPGTSCVLIGAGGLGHIGIQCLAALTATKIIVVDRNPDALKLAEQLGAHHTVGADGGQVDAVKDLTGGGAEVVLDFVAEQGAENDGFAMTRE